MTTGSTYDVLIGTIFGFMTAFCFLNGAESAVKVLTWQFKKTAILSRIYLDSPVFNAIRGDIIPPEEDIELESGPDRVFCKTHVQTVDGQDLVGDPISTIGTWEPDAVERAAVTINTTGRGRITSHMNDLMQFLDHMQSNLNLLVEEGETAQLERIAEQIDEDCHSLQYKIDRSRRVMQGVGSGLIERSGGRGAEMRHKLISDEKKQAMLHELSILQECSKHILSHLSLDRSVDAQVVQEMFDHLSDMQSHMGAFHEMIDRVTWRWKSLEIEEVRLGDRVPFSVVAPVVVDGCVDGFLIGITLSASLKAGYILAAANCIEMGTLGMAYSSRIARCTGSPPRHRLASILAPPILMALATVAGASLSSAASALPVALVAFVAFGVYALVSLVTCELLVEGWRYQEELGTWWMKIFIFIGIYAAIGLEYAFE